LQSIGRLLERRFDCHTVETVLIGPTLFDRYL